LEICEPYGIPVVVDAAEALGAKYNPQITQITQMVHAGVGAMAAIGRGQLKVLEARVKRKREIFDYYKESLGELPGIEFMPEASYGKSNRWLTVILITPEEFGAAREEIRIELEKQNIESRPVWKPMHLQPVFKGCRMGHKNLLEGVLLCIFSLYSRGVEYNAVKYVRTFLNEGCVYLLVQ
jgi:dTDP-4-amino-4,6-dideoxygalactose transaminase